MRLGVLRGWWVGALGAVSHAADDVGSSDAGLRRLGRKVALPT